MASKFSARTGLFCLLFLTQGLAPANAGWTELWQTGDQQGIELFNNGETEQAAEAFDNPEWRGTATFQSGDFAGAAREFSQSDSTDALYNQATALAHAGELEQSLKTFDQLLARQPDHEDGIANRDWVIRQQQEQAQQNQQQQQGEGESQDQQQDSSSQAQNENGEEGESDQQQAGANNEDGREMSKNESANGQEGQQSAENSLKDALQNQQQTEQKPGETAESQQAQNTQSGEESSAEVNEIPYTEASQAIEQQLQRIPDDPAGLLRNKLYVTHQARYPKVREGEEPW